MNSTKEENILQSGICLNRARSAGAENLGLQTSKGLPFSKMKMISKPVFGQMKGAFWLFPVAFFLLISCISKPENQTGMPESEVNKSDSNQSISTLYKRGKVQNGNEFSYYLPIGQLDSTQSIFLVFFDPQGKGSFPIEKYKPLAEKYGINLVGSNQSKNGTSFEQTRLIAKALISKILNEFPGKKKRIYFSGFSGGAKVAIDAGMAEPSVKAVVYTGAPWKVEAVTKPVLGFAGTGDMNYADLLAFDQTIPSQISHFLVEWEGKHAWPDSVVFEDAMVWISIRENLQFFDGQKYIDQNSKPALKEKDVKAQVRLLSKLNFFASEGRLNNPSKAVLDTLMTSPGYQKAMALRKNEQAKELELKLMYNQAFIEKNQDWWKVEIEKLRQPASAETAALNHRLLGYFSLAAYSYSNQVLASNQLELAGKILEIYHLSDPENPEQAYLRAVLAAKTNQTSAVLPLLELSVDLGFAGKNRLMNQAEFQSFRQQARFLELLGKVKN